MSAPNFVTLLNKNKIKKTKKMKNEIQNKKIKSKLLNKNNIKNLKK